MSPVRVLPTEGMRFPGLFGLSLDLIIVYYISTNMSIGNLTKNISTNMYKMYISPNTLANISTNMSIDKYVNICYYIGTNIKAVV